MHHLIGRDKEKAELYHYIDLLQHGKGSILLITGSAGIGKTAFVEETINSLELNLLIARANEDLNIPYSLFTSIFRACLRKNENLECGPLKKYLAVILPELGEPPEDVDSETLKEAIISAVISLSQKNPLIIFFDDIHWADSASLEIIPLLADKISGHRILLISTYRDEEVTREHQLRKLRVELKRLRKLNEIILSPLNLAETKQLSESLLNGKISVKAAEIIHHHTLGFPLFIEEITGLLAVNKKFTANDNVLDLDVSEIPYIPETVNDTALFKISLLSEQAKNALETASLLGQEFSLNILSELTNSTDGIAGLIDTNWLKETSGDHASFRHALLRKAVKGQINWLRKKEIHLNIAEALIKNNSAPGEIAEHLLAAGETEKGIDLLSEAIDNYIAVYGYEDAAGTAKKLLALWKDEFGISRKTELLKKYAFCLQFTGDVNEAIISLKEIIEIAESKKSSRLLAETYRSLAAAYGLNGLWDLSISSRVDAAEFYLESGLPGEAAIEYLLAAGKSTAMLQLNNAAEYARRTMSIADDSGIISLKARAMGLHGNIISMLGRPEEGKNIVHEALTIALDNNDTDAASEIYRRLASSMEYASDYQGARSVYSNAYDFCINHGEEINARVCLSCMSYIYFQTGEWKKSIDMCKEVLQSKYTPPTSIPIGYGMIGTIQALRGETKNALKNLTKSLDLARKYNITIIELFVLWGLAICYEKEENFQSAEECYLQIIAGWYKIREMHDIIPLLMWASVFFKKRKNKTELGRISDILTKISAGTGNPEAMGILAFVLAETSLLNGKTDDSITSYYKALEHIEKPGVPLELMLTQFRLAEALSNKSNFTDAAKHLNSALRIAKKLGTRPIASSIEEFMKSIGLETKDSRNENSADRITKFGMTLRQYEIFLLIAEGLTNKEIAQKLFLSSRTVDMHVSNILQRLNCRTRTEAISKLQEV